MSAADEQAREVEELVEQVRERLDPDGHGWAAGEWRSRAPDTSRDQP
ncbi:hypothetical protein QE370_000436 [Aeromicrobium sp. SORGH_AS981]|nr:hypothetical protein [Aeromicrobium sp. SORGH_AS_0981]MDR6117252.1 hypothetical protein [Aeromicrobium sp. SORGH_AS_0981]